MRFLLPVLGALALAACAPPRVPDSAAGVGFDSYADYMRGRQAQLARPGAGVATPPAAAGAVASEPLSAIRADPGPAALASPPPPGQTALRPRGDAPATITPRAGEMLAFVRPSISDEQDFDAVAARESIESDRERLERLRQVRVDIAPTEVPDRTAAAGGPNIVEYALRTRNRVGERVWDRGGLFRTEAQHRRNCAAFPSADLAQEDFLRRGGPSADPRNLDPDGDGFACDWDPTPFRAAARG
jgi:hypothetical protein